MPVKEKSDLVCSCPKPNSNIRWQWNTKSTERHSVFLNGSKSCFNLLQVIPLLSHVKPHIAQEALALIKAMLFSGNTSVQTGIEENARETKRRNFFLELERNS